MDRCSRDFGEIDQHDFLSTLVLFMRRRSVLREDSETLLRSQIPQTARPCEPSWHGAHRWAHPGVLEREANKKIKEAPSRRKRET
jgi:hypothetical protein